MLRVNRHNSSSVCFAEDQRMDPLYLDSYLNWGTVFTLMIGMFLSYLILYLTPHLQKIWQPRKNDRSGNPPGGDSVSAGTHDDSDITPGPALPDRMSDFAGVRAEVPGEGATPKTSPNTTSNKCHTVNAKNVKKFTHITADLVTMGQDFNHSQSVPSNLDQTPLIDSDLKQTYSFENVDHVIDVKTSRLSCKNFNDLSSDSQSGEGLRSPVCGGRDANATYKVKRTPDHKVVLAGTHVSFCILQDGKPVELPYIWWNFLGKDGKCNQTFRQSSFSLPAVQPREAGHYVAVDYSNIVHGSHENSAIVVGIVELEVEVEGSAPKHHFGDKGLGTRLYELYLNHKGKEFDALILPVIQKPAREWLNFRESREATDGNGNYPMAGQSVPWQGGQSEGEHAGYEERHTSGTSITEYLPGRHHPVNTRGTIAEALSSQDEGAVGGEPEPEMCAHRPQKHTVRIVHDEGKKGDMYLMLEPCVAEGDVLWYCKETKERFLKNNLYLSDVSDDRQGTYTLTWQVLDQAFAKESGEIPVAIPPSPTFS